VSLHPGLGAHHDPADPEPGLPLPSGVASNVSGTRSYGEQQRSLVGQTTVRNAAVALAAQALIISLCTLVLITTAGP